MGSSSNTPNPHVRTPVDDVYKAQLLQAVDRNDFDVAVHLLDSIQEQRIRMGETMTSKHDSSAAITAEVTIRIMEPVVKIPRQFPEADYSI